LILIFFAGIDVGSLSSEAVIITQSKKIISWSIVPTGFHSTKAAEQALTIALVKAKLNRMDLAYVAATGYGRISVPFADKCVTEIVCHGLGAHYLFPQTGTIIDIGGQDFKVIKIDKKGKVIDFSMNDKCAAGTGRFLDIMADRLKMSLDDFMNVSLKSMHEVEISSICTVFAESEVVNLIAHNKSRVEIICGLHKAVVDRIWPIVRAIGVRDMITMSGGVAKNINIINFMQRKFNRFINIPREPQIIGALGAALMAKKSIYRNV